MNVTTVRLLMLSVATTLVACADDLKSTDNGDKDAASNVSIQTLDKGDDVHETTVNASAEDKYLYFDLDKPAEVDKDSADWDLAFSRFKIKANGGDSGKGDVVVAKLEGVSFDDLSQAPTESYVEDSDEVSSESEGGDPSYGFLGPKPWYSYTETNHQLAPADYVYVVRSTKDAFFKVKLLGYYDKAGTGGYPRFQWAKIDKPSADIKIAEQSSGAGDAGTEPDDEQKDAGSASEANPAAFGCYSLKVHMCDCGTDQAACESAMGAWTDQCACDKK